MGIFTSRWERAHRSLTGLSSAQKLSAGILTTLMIGAVVWMTRQSRSVMEPVLDQPFAMADVITIGEHLTDKIGRASCRERV